MQKAFDLIVERLEEKLSNLTHNQKLFEKKHDLLMKQVCESEIVAYEEAIEIVNQVAEEYKGVTTCYLGSPCEYQNEDIRVDENEGWIPCSSEPTEEGSYIVAWVPEHLEVRCDSPHYYGIFEYENGEWSIDVPNGYKNIGIVMLAYRPLPQPYQPKGE